MIIVTGLPGSGTTALMRMLEAGGMPVLHDPDHHPADDRHPHGRYEIDLRQLPAVTQDSAVKIVDADLDRCPAGQHRWVMTWRECRAIAVALGIDAAAAEARQLACLERIGAAHVVHYTRLMRDTAATVEALVRYIGRPLDTTAMRAVIDPTLWHHRTD